MNEEDIKALKESIAHWDRIAHGVEASYMSENCSLCKLAAKRGYYCCESCVVMGHTSFDNCIGTPFWDFFDSCFDDGECLRCNDESAPSAEQEIEFLINLLPEEERKEYDID